MKQTLGKWLQKATTATLCAALCAAQVSAAGTAPTREQTENDIAQVLHHEAFLTGFADGTVRPDAAVTRGDAASIICRLQYGDLGDTAETALYFQDVPLDAEYAKAANHLHQQGIIYGTTDGFAFAGARGLTRGELAAVLVRLGDMDMRRTGTPFPDTGAHWAGDAIARAREEGLFVGYPDGSFHPEATATRAELATVLCRLHHRGNAYRTDDYRETAFPDLDRGAWYFGAVMEAAVPHDYVLENGVEAWLPQPQ